MCIKYLVIFIDAHLNWKSQILHISKKIKRCVGILSKLRHYVNIDTLIMFYYSLIYFFLNYCTITWGNTYPTTLQPLTLLQKRAVRIITFSDFKAHTTPLFYHLKLLKRSDLIYFKNPSSCTNTTKELFRLPSVASSYLKAVFNSTIQDWQNHFIYQK